MCQKVSVRRTRDGMSSTYTYATISPDENETSSEAIWAMFQQRPVHCFTTEDLEIVKTNLENGKDTDPALYIGTMAFCRRYVSMIGCKGSLTNERRSLGVFTWLPSTHPWKLQEISRRGSMEHHRPSLASMQLGVPYMRHPHRILNLHPQRHHKKTLSL